MDFYTEGDKKEIAILHSLKEVIDPEVTINIVDMGLIYKITYNSINKSILVTMTLSSKGCPMSDLILTQVKECLNREHPECTTEINLVWEPKWTRDFITPAGRKQLGLT
ncbi:MAG: metal-sulfur cluster assembly factor [Bacteroidetes bacterium]|nr:metal-sulfur cluster assembly factor [Bacteroidota bacterium]